MKANILREAVEAFDLTEHRIRLDDRERDASLGLVVMVVGEGNFGKSSLVNALCGKQVAQVAVIPKTFKIDVYMHGPANRAMVRRKNCDYEVHTHSEAALISQQAEELMKSGGISDLAEIVWQYDDLNLPKGVSLADTPGISQALAGSAKGLSLTQVLGSTFEIDEVWAHWFHRADVVIWGFCANKMQSSDTRAALEGALNLFDKRIIPVATKADFIPQSRWHEVQSQFDRIYGPLLKGRNCGPLFLTVCGGNDPTRIGEGVAELRRYISSMAIEAQEVKQAAQVAFIKDESTTVSTVLEATAEQLVSNLRAIASLGDTLAVEAEKEVSRAAEIARSQIGSYLRTIRLSPELRSEAANLYRSTRGGRQGDIQRSATRAVNALVDNNIIQSYAREAFTNAARALEATATRLAASSEIQKLTFKSSGEVVKSSVDIRLKLQAANITMSVPLSVGFKTPQGFLGEVWDFFKDLFGLDRFSEEQIHKALQRALKDELGGLDSVRFQVLYTVFAPAIHQVIQAALQEHLKGVDRAALAKLSLVDKYLPALKADPVNIITAYSAQGTYWSTLVPEVQTLLNLARVELTKKKEEFCSLLMLPVFLKGTFKFPSPNEHWESRQQNKKHSFIRISFKHLIERGTVLISSKLNGKTSVEKSDFLPHCLKQKKFDLQSSNLVTSIDAHLASCVVGVKYKSAGDRLVELGVDAFRMALVSTERSLDFAIGSRRFFSMSLAPWTLLVSVGLFVSACLTIYFSLVSALALFVLSACLFFVGAITPFINFRLQHFKTVDSSVTEEVNRCCGDAPNFLPRDFVDSILKGMVAELAPRPLQKLVMMSRTLRN